MHSSWNPSECFLCAHLALAKDMMQVFPPLPHNILHFNLPCNPALFPPARGRPPPSFVLSPAPASASPISYCALS